MQQFPAPYKIPTFTQELSELSSPIEFKGCGLVQCVSNGVCILPLTFKLNCEPPTKFFRLFSLQKKQAIQHNFQLPKRWSGWGDTPSSGVLAQFARGGGVCRGFCMGTTCLRSFYFILLNPTTKMKRCNGDQELALCLHSLHAHAFGGMKHTATCVILMMSKMSSIFYSTVPIPTWFLSAGSMHHYFPQQELTILCLLSWARTITSFITVKKPRVINVSELQKRVSELSRSAR